MDGPTMRPRNWDKFQHYKDRAPPWIKLHRELLDDYDFCRLPLASRALAPMLWLLAAEEKDGHMTADVGRLAFRLRVPEQEVIAGLTALIDKGFFDIASGVLADCYQHAIPETEAETEAETEDLSDDKSSTPDGVAKRPGICETIAEVYHDVMTGDGKGCAKVATWTPKRQRAMGVADKMAADVCKRQGWDYGGKREQFWRAYFEQCRLDPWLRGDLPNPNNPSWKQNIFVLTSDTRFGDIMDRAIAAMRDGE